MQSSNKKVLENTECTYILANIQNYKTFPNNFLLTTGAWWNPYCIK